MPTDPDRTGPAEPGGGVSPETRAAGAARSSPLTPEEQRELDRRLARPTGERPDAGRAPDPDDDAGGPFAEADDVRAAFGTAGAPQEGGQAGGQAGYGGMGGDGTAHAGTATPPAGREAAPVRMDDGAPSERGNPDELAGRDETRRNPAQRDDQGPGGHTVFSNAARDGREAGRSRDPLSPSADRAGAKDTR